MKSAKEELLLKFADIDFSWTSSITGDDVECLEEENKQEEDSNILSKNI